MGDVFPAEDKPGLPSPPDPAHEVCCELDAAYTRNVSERFDGLTHPPDHDGVQTFVNVWAEPEVCGVDLTIADAGIRLNLSDDDAEQLGCILIAEAARSRREAGLTALAAFADACPRCFPGDPDPVLPLSKPVLEDGSLRASYRHGECGAEWECWWHPEAVGGWPLRREGSAA